MYIKKKMQEADKAKSARNGPVIKKKGIDNTRILKILSSVLLIRNFKLNQISFQIIINRN